MNKKIMVETTIKMLQALRRQYSYVAFDFSGISLYRMKPRLEMCYGDSDNKKKKVFVENICEQIEPIILEDDISRIEGEEIEKSFKIDWHFIIDAVNEKIERETV